MPWTCIIDVLILACFTVLIRGMHHDELRFTSEPGGRVYVQNNRSFLVPCQAVGEEPLTKRWRNESVVDTDVAINVTSKGLWFANGIQRTTSASQRIGVFRCIARNIVGVAMSRKFQLEFVYLRNISVSIYSPQLFGNVVRLKCNVDTNLPVTYTWYKNSILLNTSLGNKVEALPSGLLRILDYSVSDDGNYSCRAQNKYNESLSSQELKVAGQTSSNISIHIYPGKYIHAMVGDPLVIECIQYSPHKSTIIWRKVTSLVTKNLSAGAGFAKLVFDSVQTSDAGEYRCMATNGVEHMVRLSVQAPPSFTRNLPVVTRQKEGERVILTCHASGQPSPTITWYKNSRVLVENSRLRVYGNKLELKNVVLEDQGLYQCEIENEYGSSVDQSLLVVLERLDPPSNVRGYALSTSEVNITWQIPPSYKSVFFVVHCLDYMRKFSFQQITHDNATHFVVKQLKPYTQYAIYVKLYANNRPGGQSNAIWVRTLGTIPSGPPNAVKLTNYSSETLDVSWLPPFIINRNGKITGYEIHYFRDDLNTRFNRTVSKDVYTVTLENIVRGRRYHVQVAARTEAGIGPYSEEKTCFISSKADTAIPPPLVSVLNSNKSIVINVKPRATNMDIVGYQLTYRYLGHHMSEENPVTKEMKMFQYELKKIEATNLEYAIEVAAYGPGKKFGRPAIVVVETEDFPTKVNYTMFESNYTDLPPLRISCEPVSNTTSLLVRWEKVPLRFIPQFEVRYFVFGESEKSEIIMTNYFNATIPNVLPGNIYTVQVKTIIRHHSVLLYSTSRMTESELCSVPEKKPDSPPLGIMCNISNQQSVIVEWQAPRLANGKILQYHVAWKGFRGDEKKLVHSSLNPKLLEITKFQRNESFTVMISAENSAGQSPFGHCVIDTSRIEVQNPGSGPEGKHSTDDGDIEKGIIIGCIISVLLLFVLVMFVCWSGCRRRKPAQRRDEEHRSHSYSNTKSHPDTVSTEVSEISSRHHALLKKYIDEETSKESDRGVGMTPKSSRLFLDCEKMPFLPRAVNQSGSGDTSCDSQDSGFGTKFSPAPKYVKEPDKMPLRQPENGVVETVF